MLLGGIVTYLLLTLRSSSRPCKHYNRINSKIELSRMGRDTETGALGSGTRPPRPDGTREAIPVSGLNAEPRGPDSIVRA